MMMDDVLPAVIGDFVRWSSPVNSIERARYESRYQHYEIVHEVTIAVDDEKLVAQLSIWRCIESPLANFLGTRTALAPSKPNFRREKRITRSG
jgi:hypothetical protein